MPPAPLPPGFTQLRYEQELAIAQTLSHYEQGAQVVTLDGPTGVGKSLIGEVVRRELDERGLYLCDSRALQDQFARSFPEAAVLKGRRNYPTQRFPDRFRSKWDAVSCDDCTWTKKDPTCDLCWAKNSCPYEVAKSEALERDLVCQNTSYFLVESNHIGRFRGRFVVLDEATLLERALLDMTEVVVTQPTMKALGIRWPKRKTVQEAWVAWFHETIAQLEGQTQAMKRVVDPTGQQAKRLKRLERLTQRLDLALHGVEGGGWVFDGYDQGRIEFRPIDVHPFGPQLFWDHSERFLCMDAAMGNGAAWFTEEVGGTRPYAVVECDSPFDIEQREIHYTPVVEMTWSNREEAWPKMAKGVAAVLEMHPDERVLVHTFSYFLANKLVAELKDPRVATYLDAYDKDRVVTWFEETPGAVLVAPSMERGYDGADDKCRVVVVAKMPFPGQGDKRIATILHGRGWRGEKWYARQTARYLMQETGRGTRHEKDWSVSYILDAKFAGFYRQFEDELSGWWKQALVWNGPRRRGVEQRVGTTV